MRSAARLFGLRLLLAMVAAPAGAAADAPPIGAAVRFQAEELGPGWQRGFFNQQRTVPPCYLVMTFEPRETPDQPLRVAHTIPVARLQRLQATTAPGTSMQEWNGLALPEVPEAAWTEVDLGPLQPDEGRCRFEEASGRPLGGRRVSASVTRPLQASR